MGKTRFGVLDLQVQARELRRRLVGARVANVYDINGRTYVLKLSVPPARTQAHLAAKQAEAEAAAKADAVEDGGDAADISSPADAAGAGDASGGNGQESWSKVLLLIESGARIHTTNFTRDAGTVPSGFCLKLRKHIRTRRLDGVVQLGGDRVLALSFSGGGRPLCNLVVEFYAGGNVILTDPDWAVLSMLRARRPREPALAGEAAGGAEEGQAAGADAALAVGDRYPMEAARVGGRLTREALEAGRVRSAAAYAALDGTEGSGRAARRRRSQAGEARRALAATLGLGPQLVEHALVRAGLAAAAGIWELEGAEVLRRVFDGLKEVENMVSAKPARGYLFGTEDVTPFMLAQYEGRECEEFEVFDDAVDAYFVKLEMSRAGAAKAKREAAAFKKVNKLTAELRGQVTALETMQLKSRQKAQAIESNVVEVEAAIAVVNSALAASVDWENLARMVEDERGNGNPVAEIIHSLHLERNEITLMLEDAWGQDGEDEDEVNDGDGGDGSDGDDDEDDDDDGESGNESEEDDGEMRKSGRKQRIERSAATRKALLVDVDLSLSAHANAREYYGMKKTAAMKMEKAVEATDRTIKAASKRAEKDAQKIEAEAVASSIRARRKAHWFEKFHWMVSSENFLVVAGRDAQQNELLVKRYMGPADAYVHADVHGASSVVVKNQKPKGASSYAELPLLTLEQAGSFAMCRSKAWDDKIVTSAWWVRASQVSKTPPTGLSLATGSFVIRGKKNFLNPSQLVMGFAFLFKVDESCVAKHRGERCVRGSNDDAETALPAASASSMNAATGADTRENSEDGGEVLIVGGDKKDGEEKEYEDDVNHEEGDKEEDDGAEVAAIGSHAAGDRESSDEEENDGGAGDGSGANGGKAGVDDAALFSKFGAASPSNPSAGGGSKYGLDDAISAADDQGADALVQMERTATRSSKPRMSAKRRREIKKAATTGSAPSSAEQAPVPQPAPALVTETKEPVAKQASTMPIPRGKKSKLKKLAKKYKDQDDEERELALRVLGAQKVKEERAPADDKDDDEADGGGGKDKSERNRKSTERTVPRGRAQRQERNEVRHLMEEEGILELSELELDSLNVLDMLTAVPEVDDVVEYALPICAPYSALASYRYRVKLVPGGVKRGKAYRSSLGLFLRQAEKELRLRVQERDAMRICPESDAIQMMLGNVRVASAGVSADGAGGKKKKKSK
jgi:predicted ribosome quality control (RQC) complex YloA/Tae2 family protein